LSVAGLPVSLQGVQCRQYQVDDEHCNAFRAWERMGAPPNPTPEQYRLLEKAGQFTSIPGPSVRAGQSGGLALEMSLPRQAVSLLEWTW
jgi:xylan 1,4-beta-xylosidase